MKLVLVMFCVWAVSAQMSLNLNGANYQVASGYWLVTVPIFGGIPPYTVVYQSFPAGWSQNGNALAVPVAAANAGGSWAVRLVANDATQNKLQRTLFVKINEGAIFLGDYPFEQVFSQGPNGNTLPLTTSITSTSSKTYGGSNSATNFGSTPSPAGVIPLQSSSPGSNVPLPSSAQLDSLIDSGDIVSIAQTIQQVIASSLPCPQKSGYLNDFLGRIQSYISIKQSQAEQSGNIITNSQSQIDVLNKQIANFTASSAALGLSTLQIKLSGILVDLQKAYDQYNTANVDLTPYNLNITANLQTINTLSVHLRSTKSQLTADTQSAADTDALIVSLEKQLAEARKNKEALQVRILLASSQIQTTQQKIDLASAQNVIFNNQINAINTNKASLQAIYQSLQAQAQNTRTAISAVQTQQNQYTLQINQLKKQLAQAANNLDSSSLISIKTTIDSLNSAIPSLKQQIDYVRFNCNGAVNYTVNTLNGTITYTFASSVFSNYVSNQYGQTNANNVKIGLAPPSKVTITPISIFTPNWIDLFGSSFKRDLSQLSSGLSSSYFFASDFSCASSSPLTAGSGTVKSISENTIEVSTGGASATLTLGACSSVLLMNEVSPKVGNSIFWRGVQVRENTFQIYSTLLF